MSSKVSKSEKTKLKFAQSNINHVYRGNTAETHHKPTVRQYGMQVVGKVQGTRRLPPPAWVPSIKAETGGLDSRVSIVPPGGSGWGAPTESKPTTTDAGATAEVGSPAITVPLSSVNGSLSREAIGTSFEPAYARSLGASCEASNKETAQKQPTTGSLTDSLPAKSGENGTGAHLGSTAASGTGSLPQPTAWSLRTQTTVASGGLAANKPFFQRPPPVTTTTTTMPTRSEEQKPLSSTAGGGASEIVGEPTGWAAVSEEEPNFDERILFSDEEESQDDSKVASKSNAPIQVTSQSDTNLHPSSTMTSSSAKQSSPLMSAFTEPETATRMEKGRSYPSAFCTLPSTIYNDGSRDKATDSWSTADGPLNFTTYAGSTNISRHPTSIPFTNQAPGNACGMSSESECILATGQQIQHSVVAHELNTTAFNDPFFPNQLPTSRIGSASSCLLDSFLPPTDADTELQHAQRQARTQEFRSAVERARVSRQQREMFPPDGDSLLQKSVVNLINDPSDAHHTPSSQPSSAQPLLMSSSHPGIQTVLGSAVAQPPPQLLMPNVYQQQGASQNRSTLVAAAAAAAAAVRPSALQPNLTKVPHSQPMQSVPRSAANLGGPWHAAAALPSTISPAAATAGFTTTPTVPQVIQNALNMATVGPQGAHPNGVYLNPDFFLERFLEILNQQQQQTAQPQTNPQTTIQSRSLLQTTDTVTSSSNVELGRFEQTGHDEISNKNAFYDRQFKSDIHETKMSELSQPSKPISKPESPAATQAQTVIVTSSESISATASTNKQQAQTHMQQAKPVPRLMDVMVPTSTSRNLPYLRDQDDYLGAPSGRGTRGRSKMFTSEKSRGGSRGRRPSGRFASDDINITRTNSGDTRTIVNQGSAHQEFDGSSNARSWNSKTISSSRRVFIGPKSESDNRLTTSDIQLDVARNLRTDSRPTYESETDEYVIEGDGALYDTTKATRKYDESGDACSYNRQTTMAGKPRTKAPHTETPEADGPSQRRNDYNRQHERIRRGRGGSGFYYSNSRTFGNDDTSGRYSYLTEQKSYSRSTGSATFPHRGHRSGLAASQVENSPRRRHVEEPCDGTTQEFGVESRNVHSTHVADDYSNQRSTRDHRPDREWRSHEPIDDKGFQKGRVHSRTLDIRRSSVYRDEYHLSDGEPRGVDNRLNQNRQYHTNARNRSHDGQRYTHKYVSRQATTHQAHERASSQSAETADVTEQQSQEKSTSFEHCPLPTDMDEDNDIPTVRVPAVDTSFKPSRTQYARGSRSATFQRGTGLRRITSNRAVGTQQQQQSKRSTGSNLQGSRRYRESQNRYREDKDGDGGAAAGGSGRSATGGDGANTNSSGGSSGVDGRTDLGGNPNSGGSHNAGATDDCIPDTENPTSDARELNSHTGDSESNDNNIGACSTESSRSHRAFYSAAGTPDRYTYQAAASSARDQKDRSTHMSAPGNRSSCGQRFHRQGFTKTIHAATSSRYTEIAAIPPLMSIKPKGPFTRTRDFESVFNSSLQSPSLADESTKEISKSTIPNTQSILNSQLFSSNPIEEDPEDAEFLSDGFTKVVSKSSKKLARRRRMQLELSTTTVVTATAQKHTGSRRSDEAKPSLPHSKPHINESSAGTIERSQNSSSVVARSKKPDVNGPSKQPIRKVKPFPVKPTFMGPPMCMPNEEPSVTTSDLTESVQTNEIGESSSNGMQTSSKTHWQTDSKVQPAPPNETLITVSTVNTGRTWSKIVGTKASNASSTSFAKEAAIKEQPSVPKSTSDPLWSAKLLSNEKALVPQSKDSSTMPRATLTTSDDRNAKVVGITEPVKSIWSPEIADNKETVQKKDVAASVEQTNVSPAMSASIETTCNAPTTSTAPLVSTTAVTNICKVRPQQQQPSSQVVSVSTVLPASTISVTASLSPANNLQEQTTPLGMCANDLVNIENDQLDCNFEAAASNNRGSSQVMDVVSRSLHASHPVQTTWVKTLPTPIHNNYFEGRLGSTLENPFSANVWPVGDMDSSRGTNNAQQTHYGQMTSEGLFASPASAFLTNDFSSKPSRPINLAPRHQPYSLQHFSHGSAQAGDANLLPEIYGSSLGETNKLSSSNPLSQAPQAAFTTMGGSVFVTPQQPSSAPPSQQANSFAAGWTVPPNAQPNHLSQTIAHGPRFRQRMTHQLDLSSFGGYPYQTEMQNEYAFLPSVTGCVAGAPSGGPYSTVQGQPQSSYHHGSARPVMGPTAGTNPWSLLSNSGGSTGMHTSNHEYGATIPPGALGNVNTGVNCGNGGGLLPHPIPPGRFNNQVLPISSSGSTYVNHPNYVGVIGGGRPGANDLSNASGRQRGLPQGLYPTHNLTHSPSAQNQQQFQLQSAFYPSLSPSHQRVHLQQFPGSQGRNSIHSFVNQQNGLYAATYGPPPSQPTPPLHSQMGYPTNFSTESSVAPPGAFHTSIQSHSYSNIGLQPTHPHVHAHRSLQSSAPHLVSRNLGSVNSSGGSALLMPGAVGPSGVSGLPGYPQPTPSAPLSVSGYPLKPILPNL